jgi:hypothetical protein
MQSQSASSCFWNGFSDIKKIFLGEISGSHGDKYEDDVFWDVTPCSLVEVYRYFRSACCLHHQGNFQQAPLKCM